MSLFYLAYLYYSLKNKLPVNITVEDIIKLFVAKISALVEKKDI